MPWLRGEASGMPGLRTANPQRDPASRLESPAARRVEDVKLRPDRQEQSDRTVPDMLLMKAFLSGSAWRKGGPPVASGRAVAVNARIGPPPHGIARRPWTVRSNIVRTWTRTLPRWEYSSQLSLTCVVMRIHPVRLRGYCGWISPHHRRSCVQHRPPVPHIALMSQDCVNDHQPRAS